MIGTSQATRWRIPERTREVLLYAVAAGLGVFSGANLVSDGRIAKVLLVLSCIAVAFLVVAPRSDVDNGDGAFATRS